MAGHSVAGMLDRPSDPFDRLLAAIFDHEQARSASAPLDNAAPIRAEAEAGDGNGAGVRQPTAPAPRFWNHFAAHPGNSGRIELQRNSLIESGAANCDSLIPIKNSLLRSSGNCAKKRGEQAGFSARTGTKSTQIGEIPCIFSAEQGI